MEDDGHWIGFCDPTLTNYFVSGESKSVLVLVLKLRRYIENSEHASASTTETLASIALRTDRWWLSLSKKLRSIHACGNWKLLIKKLGQQAHIRYQIDLGGGLSAARHLHVGSSMLLSALQKAWVSALSHQVYLRGWSLLYHGFIIYE